MSFLAEEGPDLRQAAAGRPPAGAEAAACGGTCPPNGGGRSHSPAGQEEKFEEGQAQRTFSARDIAGAVFGHFVSLPAWLRDEAWRAGGRRHASEKGEEVILRLEYVSNTQCKVGLPGACRLAPAESRVQSPVDGRPGRWPPRLPAHWVLARRKRGSLGCHVGRMPWVLPALPCQVLAALSLFFLLAALWALVTETVLKFVMVGSTKLNNGFFFVRKWSQSELQTRK